MITYAEQIVDSIKNYPQNWATDDIEFGNENALIWLWVGTGWMFVRVRRGAKLATFSILEKRRIWKAYKQWLKVPMLREYSETEAKDALWKELDMYRAGVKGSCQTCKPVAVRNRKLQEELAKSQSREARLWALVEKKESL